MGRQGRRAAERGDRLARQSLDAGLERQRRRIRTAVSPSRCGTIRCSTPKVEDPEGVPISAIIFGGRRSNTMPLVFQAVRLEARRLRRRDDGFRNDRGRDRRGRPGAARPDGDAAVLRLQHRRLFPALARDRSAPNEPAAHFSRQLVPQKRRGQISLARIRRQHAGAEMDHRSLRRQRRGGGDRDRSGAAPGRSRSERPGGCFRGTT